MGSQPRKVGFPRIPMGRSDRFVRHSFNINGVTVVALMAVLASTGAFAQSRWTTFNPSAATVSELTASLSPYDDNQSPVLNRTTDGRLLVTWHQGAPTNGYVRAFRQDGASFSPVTQPVLLNPNTPSAWKFGHIVVPLADGGIGTFYGHSFGTKGQRFDNLLTPVGGEIAVPASDAWPDAAVLPGGPILLLSGGENNPELTVHRYDAIMRPVGSFVANQTPSAAAYLASIAVASNGNYTVAWWSVSFNIMARSFNSSSQPLGPEFIVNSSTGGQRTYPTVTYNSQNDLFIAWHGQGDGDLDGIYMRRFNSSGVALGTEVRVNQSVSGPQTSAQLAASETGEVVISWTGRDGNAEGVLARLYDVAGTAVTDEFQVNRFTTGKQRTAPFAGRHGALIYGDRMVFAWVGSGPSGTGVFLTTFTPGASLPPSAPAITTNSVPALLLGQSATFRFETSPGQAPYTWSLASGSLPSGMTLSGDGTISGTPTQAGTFSFTIRVRDSAGAMATKAFAISVTGQVLPSGLVSRWAAEGNANDSENANSGVLQNGAGFAPGKFGQAFSFDGADDVVVVNHSPSLNLANSHTIAAWAFRTSSGVPLHLVGKRVGCGLDTTFIQLAIGLNAFPSASIPLNTWTHMAVTYDGRVTNSYVNGALVASVALALGNNTAPLLIGGSGTCTPFAGLIDEVQLYNRPLSATEILSVIQPAPTISTTSVPSAQVGQSLTFRFEAALGLPPYTWSLASGDLPPGTALGSDGTLSGTPAQLGSFSFSIRLQDSTGIATTKTFTIVVTGQQAPTIDSIVSAADLQPGRALTPGQIVTIFGSGFSAPCTLDQASTQRCQLAPGFPLPVQLGETKVAFNGVPAPLLAVTEKQINLVVPWELSGDFTAAVVQRGLASSSGTRMSIARQAIGVFSIFSTGAGAGVVVHSDGRLVSRIAPLVPGEVVVIYGTGFGPVSPPSNTSSPAPVEPLSRSTIPMQVFFDGTEGRTLFSGLTPGYSGLFQMNVEVPSFLARRYPTIRIQSSISASNEISAGGPSLFDATPTQLKLGLTTSLNVRGLNFPPNARLRVSGADLAGVRDISGGLDRLTVTIPANLLLRAERLLISLVDADLQSEAPSNNLSLLVVP